MLMRRLHQFPTKMSKLALQRVLSATYADDKVRDARYKDAEEFIANLDESGLEKMKEIKDLHEFLKGEAAEVPKTIPITSWKALITEHNTYYARVKHFRFLYLDEKHTERNARNREEKRLKREKKYIIAAENKRIPEFSINVALRRREEELWHRLRTLRSDIDVIFDLNYEQRLREYTHTSAQIERSWGLNRNHLQPVKIHLTSIHKNKRLEWLTKCNSLGSCFEYNEHFIDIFDRSDLVYLSPDGPPMKKFDRNCTYVIGGVVDLSNRRHHSAGLARKLGIRCVSFPIKLHCDLRMHLPSTILTLNVVLGILLDMYLHGSWDRAFKDHLGYKYPLFSDQWKKSRENVNLKKPMMHKKTLSATDKDLFEGSRNVLIKNDN